MLGIFKKYLIFIIGIFRNACLLKPGVFVKKNNETL